MKGRVRVLGVLLGLGAPLLAAPQWRWVRSPHFAVLSDGSSRDARHVAGQLERMRALFGQMFPALPLDPVAPLEVVAVRDGREFRQLEPAAYLGRGKLELAGLFQPGMDRNYILLRLDAQESVRPYSIIYHEYTHLLVSRLSTPVPVWLNEGLAEFYETADIRGDEADIGQPVELIGLLRQRQLMPLAQMFAVDDTSPYYQEQDKASIFYAEAWALTHMIMVSDEQHHTRRLPDYLDRLGDGESPVAAAAAAFGPIAALQQQLSEYIRHLSFNYFRLELREKVDEKDFAETPAGEAAAEAVEADVLAHVGRLDDATRIAKAALAADPASARAEEALGLVAMRQHDLTAAQSWYGKAVGADAQDFLAQFSYGELTFQAHQGQLDDATAAAAEHSLQLAIQLRPDFAPAYDRLAVLYAIRNENPASAEKLERSAMRLQPHEIVYYFNLAWILINNLRPADAVTVLTAALPVAASDAQLQDCKRRLANAQQLAAQKAAADQVLAERPPPAATAAPPPSTATGSDAQSGEPEVQTSKDEAAPPPTGPRQYFEGVIQSVACGAVKAFDLQLDLATNSTVVHLHAPDYLKVSFLAANFTPTGVMNPCHDLTGLHASIHAIGNQILDITLRR
jgi:Tfp pilus assembly protein PilF